VKSPLRVRTFIAFVGSLREVVVGPCNAEHVALRYRVANMFSFHAHFLGAFAPIAGIAGGRHADLLARGWLPGIAQVNAVLRGFV
jgi:hypothetical protein